MGLKGSRNIVVGDVHYRWKLCHFKGKHLDYDAPPKADVIVHAVSSPAKLRARVRVQAQLLPTWRERENNYQPVRASVTPKDVRRIIETALSEGWDLESKKQHELQTGIVLNEYFTTSEV